jgi:flagellar basal body-associated protein FliL
MPKGEGKRMKKEIIIVVVIVLSLLCFCGYNLITSLQKAQEMHSEWENKSVTVKIYSEHDNSLIYEGKVRAFRRLVLDNGASFVDAGGHKQEIKGNVIVTQE